MLDLRIILLFHTVSIPLRRRPCAALNYAFNTNPSLIVCLAGCAASGRGSEYQPGPALVRRLDFCDLSPASLPMNAVLRPEVLLRCDSDYQAALPLASESVFRYVWESRYGTILIEVLGTDVFVNGQRVKPHIP